MRAVRSDVEVKLPSRDSAQVSMIIRGTVTGHWGRIVDDLTPD